MVIFYEKKQNLKHISSLKSGFQIKYCYIDLLNLVS